MVVPGIIIRDFLTVTAFEICLANFFTHIMQDGGILTEEQRQAAAVRKAARQQAADC